jgi:hypothetical protein
MCSSLIYKVVSEDSGPGCSLIFSESNDPYFLDFSSFSNQALLISPLIGNLTIVGGVKNIVFKIQENSSSEVSVLSSSYENVSSSSISRILELQKLKNER